MKYTDLVNNPDTAFLGYCTRLDLRGLVSSLSLMGIRFRLLDGARKRILDVSEDQLIEDMELLGLYGNWNIKSGVRLTFTLWYSTPRLSLYKIGVLYGTMPAGVLKKKGMETRLTSKSTTKRSHPARLESMSGSTYRNQIEERLKNYTEILDVFGENGTLSSKPQ